MELKKLKIILKNYKTKLHITDTSKGTLEHLTVVLVALWGESSQRAIEMARVKWERKTKKGKTSIPSFY